MTSIDSWRQRQTLPELRRKSDKACRRKGKLWTQEELDLAKAEAKELAKKLGWRC